MFATFFLTFLKFGRFAQICRFTFVYIDLQKISYLYAEGLAFLIKKCYNKLVALPYCFLPLKEYACIVKWI